MSNFKYHMEFMVSGVQDIVNVSKVESAHSSNIP